MRLLYLHVSMKGLNTTAPCTHTHTHMHASAVLSVAQIYCFSTFYSYGLDTEVHIHKDPGSIYFALDISGVLGRRHTCVGGDSMGLSVILKIWSVSAMCRSVVGRAVIWLQEMSR